MKYEWFAMNTLWICMATAGLFYLQDHIEERDKQAMLSMVDKYIEDISKVPEITKPGCKEVLAACEFERPASYLRTGR